MTYQHDVKPPAHVRSKRAATSLYPNRPKAIIARQESAVVDVCIVGLGYVGLPLAALLADKGLNVAGCDIRAEIIDDVNAGKARIIEPGLDELMAAAHRESRLKAFAEPQPAGTFIIAVPTPTDSAHKSDLTALFNATRSIAPLLQPGNLVVIESTSPVGTTDRACEMLNALRPDLTFPHTTPGRSDILMSYCPERVLPGVALRELTGNARTIGGIDRRSGERARELYAKFVSGRLTVTSARAAELSKLAENAFRDVNIAFANELSMLCERIGVDIREVISAANQHPRVDILSPGVGVGGHCIPVDPWFIHELAPDITPLIRTAREVNDRKPGFVADKIRHAVGRDLNARIVLMGLAYKPNVDDLRESPAVEIARLLAEEGYANIIVVEPHIEALPPALARFGIDHRRSVDAAFEGAAAIAILTPHQAFAPIRRLAFGDTAVIDPSGYLFDPG